MKGILNSIAKRNIFLTSSFLSKLQPLSFVQSFLGSIFHWFYLLFVPAFIGFIFLYSILHPFLLSLVSFLFAPFFIRPSFHWFHFYSFQLSFVPAFNRFSFHSFHLHSFHFLFVLAFILNFIILNYIIPAVHYDYKHLFNRVYVRFPLVTGL